MLYLLDKICESLVREKNLSEIRAEVKIGEEEFNQIITFFEDFGLIEIEYTGIKPTKNMLKFLDLPTHPKSFDDLTKRS